MCELLHKSSKSFKTFLWPLEMLREGCKNEGTGWGHRAVIYKWQPEYLWYGMPLWRLTKKCQFTTNDFLSAASSFFWLTRNLKQPKIPLLASQFFIWVLALIDVLPCLVICEGSSTVVNICCCCVSFSKISYATSYTRNWESPWKTPFMNTLHLHLYLCL